MDFKCINKQILEHAKALEWPRWSPQFPICIGIRADDSLKISNKLGAESKHWLDDSIDYFAGHPEETCVGLPESKTDGFFIYFLRKDWKRVGGLNYYTFCKSNPIFIWYFPIPHQQDSNLETYWNF